MNGIAAAPATPASFSEALVSSAPAPSLGDAAGLYSWLIGSWEADAIDFRDEGPPLRQRGEWHFSWVCNFLVASWPGGV